MFAVEKLQQPILAVTEEEQLKAIRAGNERVYENVFREHYTPLCRYAVSIVKEAELSEDLVQQVFVTFWEKREQTIITGALKSYLFRSVHNQCLNVIKHNKVKAHYQNYSQFYETKYANTVEESLIKNELLGQIELAVADLPPECAKVFRMSRFDELKYKEIAEKLGISVKTVENQIGKALKLLRGSLSEYLISALVLIFKL